jgi:hypothetical protein
MRQPIKRIRRARLLLDKFDDEGVELISLNGGKEIDCITYIEAFAWPAYNCTPELWDTLESKRPTSGLKKLTENAKKLRGYGNDKDTFMMRFKVECELHDV